MIMQGCRCKVNMQKSISFLYMSSEQGEFDISNNTIYINTHTTEAR